MLEGRHYQNAYITRDIAKAIDLFHTHTDVKDASHFDASVEVTTPTGRGVATMKLSFIWINDLQYELIEPVSGLVDLYRDALPEDDRMLFHHTCMRVDDWDVFRENVNRRGAPVVLEGGDDQLRFLFLDAREFLGHYLEYTWMVPERWTQLGGS